MSVVQLGNQPVREHQPTEEEQPSTEQQPAEEQPAEEEQLFKEELLPVLWPPITLGLPLSLIRSSAKESTA